MAAGPHLLSQTFICCTRKLIVCSRSKEEDVSSREILPMKAKWFAALLTVLLSVTAHACSCFNYKPCGALRAHGTLFVGKALRVREIERPDTAGSTLKLRRRIYTFAVTETFSGQAKTGQEVEIETGMGNGDCGYIFELGEAYFVDAGGSAGKLETTSCGYTSLAWMAELLIGELRAAAHPGRIPSLAGFVLKQNPTFEGPTVPMEGVIVTATSVHGRPLSATTDANGIFRFAHLPSATYKLQYTPPAGLFLPKWGTPQPILVRNGPNASAACHAQFYVFTGGSITVHVTDRNGKPVPGHLSATPPDRERSRGHSESDTNKTGGLYTIAPLVPEAYQLQFYPLGSNEPGIYFPGTTDPTHASLVTVEEGKNQDIRFVLP